jgi:hypothetical protein
VAAQTFFMVPGPLRGKAAAEYVAYHLCVRPPLKTRCMAAATKRNYSEQSAEQHMLFRPGFWFQIFQATPTLD